MSNLQFSITLQANPIQLLNIATDYENLSKYLPKQLESIKIIEQKNDEITTEEKLVFKTIMKNIILQQTIHKKISDNETYMRILSGPAKGTIVRSLYEKIDNGTRVLINADLQLSIKFKVFYPIIKKEYKKMLMGILFKMNTDALNNMTQS